MRILSVQQYTPLWEDMEIPYGKLGNPIAAGESINILFMTLSAFCRVRILVYPLFSAYCFRETPFSYINIF